MRVYMDYAATTPVDPRVVKAMLPYFTKKFGNTMSPHFLGQEVRKDLEKSREKIAELIGVSTQEVIFTSSATESNNLALKGFAFANKDKGNHIIVSSIEHHCVLEAASWLEKQGFEVTRLPVDSYGFVNLEKLEESIRKNTILVSIIHASNEIGTIQPMKEIAKICKEKDVCLHTDAAQSFGKIHFNAEKIGVDMATISSHKIYGPKGVGALYVRKGIKLEPLLHGGGHEFGLRSSTVNVAGIVGFSTACEIAKKEMKKESERLIKLRDLLTKKILKIENSHLNGHPKQRLPTISNFWFNSVEGEVLVTELDSRGVAASTGSACSSKSLEPSHVLLAIGLKHSEAQCSLRLSIGRWTTKREIEYVARILPKIIQKLRS